MATPGQIQIYSPARQLPAGFTGRPAPAPVRPTPQQARAGRKATPALAGRWGALDPYVQAESDKATQARAQEAAAKAQKEAQDAAYKKLPWWKKGIASVIDNPITKVALAPAEVLSVPMKAIAVGKEELSSHLPRGMAEALEDPFGVQDDSGNAQPVMRALDFLAKVIPLSPVGVDTEKARAEKRSVLERLAPRSDFGHGQIQTSTGNQWGNRFQGLGADVLNDPLMLLEGGGTVTRPAIAAEDALKAIGRGERLALPEAQRALMTSERATAEALERSASALPTGVRTAEEEIARQAAGRSSAEARFADDIHRPRVGRPEAEIPLPKNLQERMNLASEWATENPELWRKHRGEVSKGIKRGFESMSPAAKADLGVKTGGISVRGIGVELPGSEALRQVWKDAGGARRAKTSDLLDKLPKEGTWNKVRNMRVPKGQESSYAAMRRAGTSEVDAELALNNVFVRNQLDIGKNVMKARGKTYLSKTIRELRDKYSDAEIAKLVQEAETSPNGNRVNQLFKDIIGEHEKLTGRKLVSSIDADTYLPHTLDSEWRRFMLANPDDPFVQSFMRANDIVKDDLLEASHYIDKSRKLRLPEGVAEAEFDFAGRKVKLKGNSVAAKNEAMHEAFPEWKGDFYSTDIKTIGESYLDSISNDAGAHFARQQLANTKSPFVRTLDGLLWDEYQKMNETLAQRPYARRVTDVTAEGYKSGTGVDDIAPSPAEPTSEYFRKEKDVKLTEQLAEDVQGAGRQWRRDFANDASDVYEKAQEDASTLRRTWGEGLRNEAKAGNPRIKALQKQIEKYQEYAKSAKLKLGKMTSDDADELVTVLANVDDHIAFLKKELSNTNRVWNGKITRESKKVDNELAAELRKLTKVRADLEEHVSNVGSRLRAEIEERRAWINGDLAEKEAALAAKEKTVPKPEPSQPDVLNRAMEQTGFKSHPEYQRMKDRYTEAIRALESSREDGRLLTKGGKIRRSEQKLIDEVETARDALRRVGWDPAKDPARDLVQHNGTDKAGRSRYKVGNWRIEPTKPETSLLKVRDTGPMRQRTRKVSQPRWRVVGPDGETKAATLSFEAAHDYALAEHLKEVDPPQYFHGTSTRVSLFEDDKGKSTGNLIGPGTYTTENEKLGIDYSRIKGQADTFAPSNEVYRMEGPKGPKLDLDKKVDYNLRHHMMEIVEREIAPYNANGLLTDPLNRFQKTVVDGLGGNSTGEDAMLAFIGLLKEAADPNVDLISKEMADQFAWELNKRLRDDGYVAMTHTGGRRLGTTEHPVTVWLDPSKVEIKDVLHQKGTYGEAKRELEEAKALVAAYDGPTDAPPKFLDNPNVPAWMNVNGVQRPALTKSTINPEWQRWMDWANAQSRIRVIEDRMSPHGNLHPYVQMDNWNKEQARYAVELENATKEERAAVEAARAGRDARAQQRESIVRSGPEVGRQTWPTESTNQVRTAEQELAAKAAEVPRPHSRQQVEKARQLEAEEKLLHKLRYEGSMTPKEYEERLAKATRARDSALEDLKLKSGKDKPPGEMNRQRNQIEADYSRSVRSITEQYEARLPADEFERRMAVVQDAKARLKMGPRTVSESATQAARDAAAKRLALKQQAPGRVVDPELFEEGALVKPRLPEEVKAVKHGQGHFVLEHPETGEIYSIDVDRASKQPKWDVTLPNGEWDSFPSLREATEYARDNMARGLATTEAQRAALPPMTPDAYAEAMGGVARSERSRRAAVTAKINRQPGTSDILSAEEWYKANVRAATLPEREALNQAKTHAKQRERFAANTPEPSPRWTEPLGGLGPGQERHVERITTPPQPEAFKNSAVSAETGQLVGIPPPRTEEQATNYLASQLQPGTENIVPGSELHNKVVKPLEDARKVEEQYASEVPFKSAEAKERINKEFGAERDEAVGAISEEQKVFANLKQDLTERESLLRKRKELTDLKDRVMKTPARSRNEELLSVIEQLEDIAKANPLLDNAQLNAAESLLHTHKEALERIAKTERFRFQVKNLEDMAKDGKLEDVFRAVLNDNWRAMHDGLLAKGDVIIDHRLAAALQNVYEISKEPGLFGRTLNAFTNLFKTYATLSPGFQVRNTLSGMFMNTADGVGLRTQLEGAKLWRKFERGGVEWLDKQPRRIQDAFAASFASGAGGRVAEAGVAGKSANRIYDKLSNNFATRGFQRWGEKVEGGLRLGMALHSMDRGETVASAVRRIGRVHFNYAEVSAFDEQAKRLIPFWTFMSRNLPLQLQEIFTNPAAYAAYGHIKRNFEGAKEENEPEYWKGLGTWRLPFDMGGRPAYLQPDFGFTRMGQDIENITDTLSMKKPLAFMNSVNPAFSAPLDFMYGKDSFTGREYGPNDYHEVGGIFGAPQAALGSLFGQVNEAGQVSDNWMNFMRSINPIADRVARLAPGAVGGTSDPARLLESYGRFVGVPIRQLSPKQQEAEALRKYYAMLDEVSRQRAMGRVQAS